MRASPPPELAVDERSLSSEEIYRRHAQQVARWAARLAGPGLDVEDLVQETFLQVHRSHKTFRGDSRLTTWLYGITERVVYSRRRRERLRRVFGLGHGTNATDLADPRPTPAEQLERRQSTQLLYAALDRLREKYRPILILFELEGLSGEQIAELTGLQIATVWARLSRGRAQLVRELQRVERRTPWR
jgi:RNA polymerase sigma-70 factor, ECF subfamily